MKNSIQQISFLLFVFNICFAEEVLKPLPQKIEFKTIKMQKIEPIRNIQLNSKLLNLDSSKLESLRENEIKENNVKPKIIRTSHSLGKFKEFKWGDFQHLIISNANGDESFWCTAGCDKLEKDGGKLKDVDLLVLWNEVASYISEAGEPVRRKEIIDVFVNRKKTKNFYSCDLYTKLPITEDGCEGEACGILKYDKTTKEVNVYEKPDFDSTQIGKLNRCEKIVDFKSHISIESLGWVQVIKPNEKLKKMGIKAGNILPMTKSLGEGYVTVCVGKSLIVATDFAEESETETAIVKRIIDNKSNGWISLKLSNAKRGYVSENTNFYMGYYDYMPEYLCPEDHPCGKNFLPMLKKSESQLSSSFEKYCKIEKGCQSSDRSVECNLSKLVWQELKGKLPSNALCAGFSISKSSCGDNWGGSFSCSCKNKNVDRQLHYSFSCTNINGLECSYDFPN